MKEAQQRAVFDVFLTIKKRFADFFCFPVDKPLFIDARKSWSEQMVTLRRTFAELHCQIVNNDDSPRQPAICQRIIDLLPALRKETSAPVITKEKFIEFMLPRIGLYKDQSELSMPALISLFDKALQFLSGYATVLSFYTTHAHNLIVIDPPWLLSHVVGRLMVEPPLPGPCINYNNGYAKKEDVVTALETNHLSGETALEMVADLGFCLEHKQLEKVLNPSKLRSIRARKHWCPDSTMVVNAGRRLKVKGTVAISNAFFPHLQVHFYHRYLTEYDEELPMWNGGIRLVAGERTPAEALIEAHPAHMSIDIIVRGRSGSESACTELLHDLTEEILRKAVEISPGSQLSVFYLSKREIEVWSLPTPGEQLSLVGPVSRLSVEFSTERVRRAIQRETYVTDGKASTPESPFDLLLSPQVKEQFSNPSDSSPFPESTDVSVRAISDEDWRVILLNLAKAVNTFSQCSNLATGLSVNDRGGDIVEQLREVDPHRGPPEIATAIFLRWLKLTGRQTTEWRRAALRHIFLEMLLRHEMCELLDDEVKALVCTKNAQTL